MANGDITVSVEKAVHNVMHDAVQAIYDQHGIIVHGVNVEWVDVSTMGQPKMVVTGINVDSRTTYEIHARNSE